MMKSELLTTRTLELHPQGTMVVSLLAGAIEAVDPAAAVRRCVCRDGDLLQVNGQQYDLRRFERVVALAIGKAGEPMLRAAAEVLGERLISGLGIVKEGHSDGSPASLEAGVSERVTLLESGHPVPDARSRAAGEQALALMSGLSERDLALVLISGGGSALVTRPVSDVTLEDLQQLTRVLLACGATINEINTLRKHLDLVKGGGLARAAGRATLVALVLSDVIGDPLDVIASGPTVPDSSTFADAWAILEQYGVVEQVPQAIRSYLRRGVAGEIPDTPKPGDPYLEQIQHVLVGSNRIAADAVLAAAASEGLRPLLLTTSLQGEAREVARALAAVAREAAASGHPVGRPCCIVAGGETTVTLRGSGRGGRNQELALAAAIALDGIQEMVFVALATDGGDGPTDAAGAVISGQTLARARELGLDPLAFLAQNDSYAFFDRLGDLLRPGPTRTNVNDLAIMFLF
jgi:glycerate 2-kinase